MFNVYDIEKQTFKNIYTIEELTQIIKDNLEYYEDVIKCTHKKTEKTKEEAKQELTEELKKENERLKERLSLSYGEFASEKEKEKYNDFCKRHESERLTLQINSGKMPYLIPTGTGIGTLLKVKCPICGEEEDITDLDTW